MYELYLLFLAVVGGCMGEIYEPSPKASDQVSAFSGMRMESVNHEPLAPHITYFGLLFDRVLTDVGGLCPNRGLPGIVRIDRSGIYWVTIREAPHPEFGEAGLLRLHLLVNSNAVLTLEGYRGPHSLSAALWFNKRDTVMVGVDRNRLGGAEGTMFSIAQTMAQSAYTAYYWPGYDPPDRRWNLHFSNRITDRGVTVDLFTTAITVDNSGVYLVSLSIDTMQDERGLSQSWTGMDVMVNDESIMSIGAYDPRHSSGTVVVWLDSDDEITIQRQSIPGLISNRTFISLIQIQQDPSYAFAIEAEWRARRGNTDTTILMDYGGMFDSTSRKPTAFIQVEGVYIACISVADDWDYWVYKLRVNGQYTGVEVAGRNMFGPGNAICVALHLQQGANLTVRSFDSPRPPRIELPVDDDDKQHAAVFSLAKIQNLP